VESIRYGLVLIADTENFGELDKGVGTKVEHLLWHQVDRFVGKPLGLLLVACHRPRSAPSWRVKGTVPQHPPLELPAHSR
jgi:hypothetical protein